MESGELSVGISGDNPPEKEGVSPGEGAQSPEKGGKATFSLFALADSYDCFLMLAGGVGACIHGAGFPLLFVLFSKMLELLGTLQRDPERMGSEISKYARDFVYLACVNLVGAWLEVAFWMQTAERQTARMRLKYLCAILRKDISFFDTKAKDENVLSRISSDMILVQDAIGDKMGRCVRCLSQFTLGFILAFTSVWQLTLLTLAVVPLIVAAGGTYAITISGLSKKSEAAYGTAGKVAEEVISQIRTVYSFVGEEKAVKLYSDSLTTALKLGMKGGVAKGLGVGGTYGMLIGAWAFLLWYGGLLVRHEVTTGAKAFTTIINVIFSGFGLGQAAPCIAALSKGHAAASDIMRVIKMDSSFSGVSDEGATPPGIAGDIEFSEVSFSYPSRPDTVFENLSFSMKAGNTCAFVGPSGSGKSTIISLIERFYNPTSGKILLDGHDICTLQLKWLRDQMGLVSQEPALFGTSIAENILNGRENADNSHIVEAAKAANAHAFIEALPHGYNTQVGEGGTQLSGGQKQRIAIARAVLRNPKILLLDEATSALDSESELIVQQALERIMVGRTTIVVAHRLSTIRDVNKIIVLKNGNVVESGNHTELMSLQGEYASLVTLQVAEIDNYGKQRSTKWSMGILGTSDDSESPKPQITESVYTRDQHTDKKEHGELESVSKPSLSKLIKLNAPEWPFAVLGSLGALLTGMERPLFSFGISTVLSVFYSTDKHYLKQQVEKIAILFLIAAILYVPIALLQHYFFTAMGERLTRRVRLLMFTAMIRNEIGWFDMDENSIGSLTGTLAVDATLLKGLLADRMSSILQNISLIVSSFSVAFVLNWRLSLVVVASLPLLVTSTIAEQLSLKGFGGDYTKAYSRATSIAREAITNIRTVAAFNFQDGITARFANELSGPNKKARLRGHISGAAYGLSQFFAFCFYAMGLWYCARLIQQGLSTFGDSMKAFMVLIITAFGFAETMGLAPDILKGSQALTSVFRILERRTDIVPDDPAMEMVNEIQGDIEFRKVHFRYPSRPEVSVFEGLNLQVTSGRSLAIAGPSGSGKSSVVSLLMRFYDPISGKILIDGKDIRGLNLKSLRLKIGLVQQEPALFSTTIYDNIKYGREEASEIEVLNAAKAANAHDFIGAMANGYQTYVGDRGVQLSGGQKQRVAIARAILKDPRILLLDEATSALDAASEKLVQGALDRLMEGRTTVLVAHRLSTIRNADTICVLQDGKVVESGSHNELINRSQSLYKQLVNLQRQTNAEYLD